MEAQPMNEILKMLNALTADELDSVLMRGGIMLEKKRKEEAEAAAREKERQRLEKIEQEKKRLEEIAALQRKLQELQSQKIVIPDEPGKATGDNFVMYDKPAAAQPKPAPAQQAPQMAACPHCKAMNIADSKFCANCGQSMSKPQPVQPAKPESPKMACCPHCNLFIAADRQFCSNCGKPVNVAVKASPESKIQCPHCHTYNEPGSVYCSNCGQNMKVSAPATPQKPATSPQPATPPQTSAAQVRYADESMTKWEMLPGEKTMRGRHEIQMLQPNGGKFAYYMEVTNLRILFTRESSGARNAALAARMGGGLVGSLIAEGVKSAAGAGPKPWLEIPLTAISNCGLQGKKEFFFVADQTYVLKNHSYEKFLPDLIANAKR